MDGMTVLGLGSMGMALARALLQACHRTTVWNRTPQRALPLASLGADIAEDLAVVLRAHSAILVCISSYAATRQLLAGAADALEGRSIIQLSTGTPREARESEVWFRDRGANYLDGAILGGPLAVATQRITLLYSGSQPVFESCRPQLLALGENTRFLGTDPGAAATLDFAWLMTRYGAYLSAAHGAVLCEAEGVKLADFADLYGPGEPTRWVIDAIKDNGFAAPTATLQVWSDALAKIRSHASESGIDQEFPDLVAEVLDRAIAAGHGGEHIAAMVKVLRR